MACKCFSKKTIKILLWIFLPLLVGCIVLLAVFPSIYNAILKKELSLQQGTIAEGIWKDIPIPIYERVYFFNITNKEAFLKGAEPLSVTEVGPYTYKARWVKDYKEWNSNDTVSYRETRTYQFVPSLSNGSLDDVIYSLNGPMILITSLLEKYDIDIRTLLSFFSAVVGEDIVIQRSIKELTYEGYKDILIKYAPVVVPNISYKDGKISWLYGKNGTNDGLFTVFTGADDSTKTGLMNKWNGEGKLHFWKGDSCNTLNGTSIELGPPIQNDQTSYAFFQSIFCRSLSYSYTEDVKHFDILSKRFKATYSLFANSTENPDNFCFDVNKERPSGVLDVSPCQFGAPIFISHPHFYMADPSFLDSVQGLNPNGEKHDSYLDIEVISGFTINAVVRFQFNIELKKIEGIFQTYNVSKGIFPILWAEICLKIDENFANYYKRKTRDSKIIAYSLFGSLAGISLILSIILVLIMILRKDDDGWKPLINEGDERNDKYGRCRKKNRYSHGSINGNLDSS